VLVLLIVACWRGGLRGHTAICGRKWSVLSTFPAVNRHQRMIQFVKFLTVPENNNFLLLSNITSSSFIAVVSSIWLTLWATQTTLRGWSNTIIKWAKLDDCQNKIIHTCDCLSSTSCSCCTVNQMTIGEAGPVTCRWHLDSCHGGDDWGNDWELNNLACSSWGNWM